MNKVKLTVNYGNYGVISIPFPNLKSCDEFTMGFDNMDDLGIALNDILGLGINQLIVVSSGVNYEYKAKGSNEINTQYLDVRFSGDVYDIEELKALYAEFFQDDRSRINNSKNGIWYVKHENVREFVSGYKNISDESIVKAVNSYLDGSYKKTRDVYFILKNNGYVAIPKKKEDKTNLVRSDLSSFDAKTPYYAYLKDYSMRGEEEYAKAMDFLAGEELDDLQRGMVNLGYGVFDGAVQNNDRSAMNLSDEMMSLEELSGKSIEELMDIVQEYKSYFQNNVKRR